MTADLILDDELRGRVRELRAAGRSPKQIARVLGVRPAAVAPLVRNLCGAATRADAGTSPTSAAAGCKPST